MYKFANVNMYNIVHCIHVKCTMYNVYECIINLICLKAILITITLTEEKREQNTNYPTKKSRYPTKMVGNCNKGPTNLTKWSYSRIGGSGVGTPLTRRDSGKVTTLYFTHLLYLHLVRFVNLSDVI